MTPLEEAVAAWLAKADDDRRATEVLAAADLPEEIAAFHAQQWAEKTLKAALVARDEDPPRTHNLATLVELIDGSASEALRAAARRLTPYAVLSRYPGTRVDAPASLPALLADARALADWAQAHAEATAAASADDGGSGQKQV